MTVKGAYTSSAVDRVARAWDGEVHVSSTGELNLVTQLLARSAGSAGEGNGGVVVAAVGLARDGLAAGLAILDFLARAGMPLGELLAELPRLAIRRSEIDCDAAVAPALLGGLARELGAAFHDPHLGVRVGPPSGAWVLSPACPVPSR